MNRIIDSSELDEVISMIFARDSKPSGSKCTKDFSWGMKTNLLHCKSSF